MGVKSLTIIGQRLSEKTFRRTAVIMYLHGEWKTEEPIKLRWKGIEKQATKPVSTNGRKNHKGLRMENIKFNLLKFLQKGLMH